MKTACIIQGNIREGFELVLHEMKKHFDVVIVSTWEDEVACIPSGDHSVLFNEKPLFTGFSHRNYQRYSTARGLEKARALGCDYVLKWRTDMLPTNLNVPQLITWANTDIPSLMSSRIVTCAFRNLTVHEDWFSSIPDLFAFGHIDMMELLWGDEGFDYQQMCNPPHQMLLDEGHEWLDKNQSGGLWCAESELYAIFRDRLQKKVGKDLTHDIIARDYMRLFDHSKLGIVWFGSNGSFRPIMQAYEHPWWSEKLWSLSVSPTKVHNGYKTIGLLNFIKKKLNYLIQKIELRKQQEYYAEYKAKING